MFFTTINRSLLSLVFAKYAAEYVLGIVPAGVHDWDKFVTTSEMTSMLRECKLSLPITSYSWGEWPSGLNVHYNLFQHTLLP